MGNYNSAEVFTFKNVSSTQGPFVLRGGNYSMTGHATWGAGSATLERLAADGATYVSTGLSLAADGMVNGNLPGGTYEIVIASATGVYIDVTSAVTSI